MRASAKKASGSGGNPLDAIGGQIPLPLPVPDWSKPIIIALALAAIWFGARSRLAARRARGLERQRATLAHDLDVMQAAVVPEVPLELDGLSVSVAHRAAEGPGGGGDFYDVFSPESGKVAVVLGDVVGHGHEALTDAALMRYTLRAYLLAGLEPRATLALAGQVLTDPGSERYVTVVIGVFDARSGDLTYATAGHPTPVILGSYEPPSICPSPAISSSLKTGRRQTKVSLRAGARVCFFSDGLTEARVEEGLFGRDRLCEILTELGPRALADDLLQAIRAAAESCPDDMSACMVLPRTVPAERFIHVEELEADGEALAAGRVERFLEECVVPAHAIPDALERAGAIAGQHGTAVIRVETQSAEATVTVSRPVPAAVGNSIIGTRLPDADPGRSSAGAPVTSRP
ncbi:MAG TPA: PP2C family protein-serine/threonine phosphatase [Solirubrobacteraceae bacterium]|nr:PP2C family protein-serine/threonine phosphatase [Solirubrobacteraceae bacterium]